MAASAETLLGDCERAGGGPAAAPGFAGATRLSALWALAVAAKLALLLAALGALACAARHRQLAAGDAVPAAAGEGSSAPPYCRKSMLLTVLPHANGSSSSSGSGNTSNGTGGLDLVVFSGMGLHKAIFDDLLVFNLESENWRAVEPVCGGHPTARWKAGNGLAVDGGMVIVGGDAYTPHTFEHEYKNDIWWLEYPALVWREAAVDPTAPAPHPRRGHSSLAYKGGDGRWRVVIFGGRTKAGIPLNDAWEATLELGESFRASWRQAAPLQQPGKDAPTARRGHQAVLIADAPTPQMMVYGGREDFYYFLDVWTLDLQSGKWRLLDPSTKAVPVGRDHHSAAYHNGKLFVFAGHMGADYDHAKPTNELWTFTLATQAWERVKTKGPAPLPRFEESYVQYSPDGTAGASRLLVFGGQTRHVCQLNDVWELDLNTLQWTELSPFYPCTKQCRHIYG